MFLNFRYDFFFQICFYRFHLLILEWLRIWLYNLFIFILPFYKVGMVCKFARVTRVAMTYEFGGVSFFYYWIWLFYHLFFSHTVKKIVSENSYVIKLYRVHEPIYRFCWLTWFAGLASLTFLNYFFSSLDIGLIKNSIS
jgi:hypothetical protein